MVTGDFLSGFQGNLGWLQQIPNWLNGISGGGFDLNSGFLWIVKTYGIEIDMAFIGLFVFLFLMMGRAWTAMKDEV